MFIRQRTCIHSLNDQRLYIWEVKAVVADRSGQRPIHRPSLAGPTCVFLHGRQDSDLLLANEPQPTLALRSADACHHRQTPSIHPCSCMSWSRRPRSRPGVRRQEWGEMEGKVVQLRRRRSGRSPGFLLRLDDTPARCGGQFNNDLERYDKVKTCSVWYLS